MTRLTRQELYNKVWSIPMIKLSKKLGISDKGLAKVCKRYNIPTPYLGYWAKIQNGYTPKKTPFKGEPDTVVCFSGNGISSNKNITSKKEQRRLKNLHARIEAVKFDALLTEASQTVSKHINKFKSSKDFQGKFLVNGNNQISKLNLPRVVTILNNIELMTRTLGGDFIYKEGSVVFILAGIWNLIASLSSFDTEKKILNRDADVPNIFQDITQLVIIGFINIVFGGLLGIALVGFDFWIRSEVLANKDIFDNQNGDKKQVAGNFVGVSCYEELEQLYQLKSKSILTTCADRSTCGETSTPIS